MTGNRQALRARTHFESGSISAFVVLLVVALFVLMGLVVDGGTAMVAQQSAYDVAEQAARTGAGSLSVDALRSGGISIDAQAATAAAVAFTVAAGHPGTATVVNGTVTVTISYRVPTSILGLVGVSSIPISATASAVNVFGVTKGD